MSDAVAVVGEGLLADFVCGKLASDCEVVCRTDFAAGVPNAAKLVLVLYDEWRPSEYVQAEEMLQRSGLPWLSGFVSSDEGVVGPLVRPGTPGCSQCADSRRLMTGNGSEAMLEQQMRLLMHEEIPQDASASRLGLLHMTGLIAAEARKAMQGRQAHTEGRIYFINLKTLKTSLHHFLPDPLCPVCGRLPDDSPAIAAISLQPCPKIDGGNYRCKQMSELKKVLNKTYLDYRTGILNEKWIDLVSPFAGVCVNVPSFMGSEVTAGRSHSFAESELTAILEGLERYCGMSPRGKRTVIHDTFRNMADQALDPVKVGVYAKEQYAQPDFPFAPFDPDRPIDWVWGYSFLRERPILVPEQLAYYSLGSGGSFVHETSNGCALGGSLEEAIFYGILEVVERDSFLMTWYAQLPVPRLDPYSADDKHLPLMIDRLSAVAGYDVLLFNSTMENEIPSVWAMAKNRKPKGANLICAAAAHLDPIRAAKSAVHEIAGMIHKLDELFEENREKVVRMYHHPSLTRRMEDHSMLYSLPQAEERLRFLLDDHRGLRTFAEQFKRRAEFADLTDDLKDILQRFKRLNLEVIAVDQTTPETLRTGLYCVKVLIPGLLPMTFGHRFIRLTGLDRVLRIPMELGYAKQPLTVEQLNPHPHPFV